jgi:leucyl aminopeptidase
MQFFVTSATPSRQRTDCAIVGIFEKGSLGAAAEELDVKLGGRISKLAKRGDVRGKACSSVSVHATSSRASNTAKP